MNSIFPFSNALIRIVDAKKRVLAAEFLPPFSFPHPPLAVLEFNESFFKTIDCEIRPENFREIEFGINGLPGEKVGEPLLA